MTDDLGGRLEKAICCNFSGTIVRKIGKSLRRRVPQAPKKDTPANERSDGMTKS